MTSSFKKFKTQALARPEVRKAYDDLAEEFAFLDEVLKARAAAGLTRKRRLPAAAKATAARVIRRLNLETSKQIRKAPAATAGAFFLHLKEGGL